MQILGADDTDKPALFIHYGQALDVRIGLSHSNDFRNVVRVLDDGEVTNHDVTHHDMLHSVHVVPSRDRLPPTAELLVVDALRIDHLRHKAG